MQNKLSMVSFEEQNVNEVILGIGLKISKFNNKNYIMDKNNNIKKCEVCETKITPNNLGSIAHGSNLCFCTNPLCFMTYIESKNE